MHPGHGILAIWNDVVAEHEAEFNAWYLDHHLTEWVNLPGFMAGWRYEADGGTPRYFTYYLVDAPKVLLSEPYRARINAPNEWTRRVMPWFRSMNRTSCRLAVLRGRMQGSVALALRYGGQAPNPEAVEACLPELHACRGIVRTQYWVAEPCTNDAPSQEAMLRGAADETIAAALLIEATRMTELAAAERVARALGSGAAAGTYRLLCAVTRTAAETTMCRQ